MIKKFKFRDRRHRNKFCYNSRLIWLFRALEKQYIFLTMNFNLYGNMDSRIIERLDPYSQVLNVARISGFLIRRREGRRLVSKMRSFCIITSRSRAVFKTFRLSRFVF